MLKHLSALAALAIFAFIILSGGLPGAGTRPAEAAPLSGATAVTAGSWHTCALTMEGRVVCWGANVNGQLGDGTTSTRTTPVYVRAWPGGGPLEGVAEISAGNNHTCAVMAAGGVMCWGRNTSGQLGDGTTANRTTPVDVLEEPGGAPLSGISGIAAGADHTCALTEVGGVKCWGSNGNGRLGDGTTTNSLTPVDVLQEPGGAPLSGSVAVSAGEAHTCALTTTDAVKCWGSNSSGRLGDGTVATRLTPVDACATGATAPCDPGNSNILSDIASFSVGSRHTCAVTTVGGVKCWGSNGSGRLGDGTTINRTTPVDVCAGPGCSATLAGGAAFAGGLAHSCALTTTGGVKCWGSNGFGQLGDKSETDRHTPVDVCANVACAAALTGAAAVAAGWYQSCALTTAGGVKCWGDNDLGQLGDGRSCGNDICTTPTDVIAPPPPPTPGPTPPPTPTPTPFACMNVTQIPEEECEVLVILYESTGGDIWLNNSGWLASDTPCAWSRVSCTSGHVTRLDLQFNNLSGSIPTQLAGLASLLWLDLRGNNLSGNIPPELGSLASLVLFDLGDNDLGGNVPQELGGLANLLWLDLSSNGLTGTIPPELGGLTNLARLDLSNNGLTGAIPQELGGLANLLWLDLSSSGLTGAIPPQLGGLTNLTELDLSSNGLTGTIPQQLSGLTNLARLDLSNNGLTGTIPPELGGLGELEELFLNSNPLTGELPPSFTDLALTWFWFHDTNVCVPDDDDLQAWLAGIANLSSTEVLCSEQTPCNPSQPWPVPQSDSDCDGFSDEREVFIGTDPFAACGPDAWPPDFNDDGVANVLDFIILSASFGTQSGDPGYSQRYDLNTDGFINVLDFIILSAFFGHTCSL